MPKVVLAIGHHDNDPGAVGNGTTEHAEVKRVVLEAMQILKERGVDIITPPTSLSLTEKVAWINANTNADDFSIEVHLDSAGATATGISTWYCAGKTKERTVAEYFANALSTRMNLRNRGAKKDTDNRHGRLAIVRDITCHGWLFEMGFLTNSGDLQKFREKGVQTLVDCVIDLFLGGNVLLPEADRWPFRDVPPNYFAFDAIKKGKAKGIIQPKEYFYPNTPITRGEQMILLERLGLLD